MLGSNDFSPVSNQAWSTLPYQVENKRVEMFHPRPTGMHDEFTTARNVRLAYGEELKEQMRRDYYYHAEGKAIDRVRSSSYVRSDPFHYKNHAYNRQPVQTMTSIGPYGGPNKRQYQQYRAEELQNQMNENRKIQEQQKATITTTTRPTSSDIWNQRLHEAEQRTLALKQERNDGMQQQRKSEEETRRLAKAQREASRQQVLNTASFVSHQQQLNRQNSRNEKLAYGQQLQQQIHNDRQLWLAQHGGSQHHGFRRPQSAAVGVRLSQSMGSIGLDSSGQRPQAVDSRPRPF